MSGKSASSIHLFETSLATHHCDNNQIALRSGPLAVSAFPQFFTSSFLY